jgi:hypothetical protein
MDTCSDAVTYSQGKVRNGFFRRRRSFFFVIGPRKGSGTRDRGDPLYLKVLDYPLFYFLRNRKKICFCFLNHLVPLSREKRRERPQVCNREINSLCLEICLSHLCWYSVLPKAGDEKVKVEVEVSHLPFTPP